MNRLICSRMPRVRRFFSIPRIVARKVAGLRVEVLEDRTVPSITIQFNYSLDPNGMFNNPAPRAALEAAARSIAGHLDTPLVADHFQGIRHLRFDHPLTGQEIRWGNITIPADTLVVYVAGRDLPSPTLADADRYDLDCHGSLCVYNRPEFAGWGGVIRFDTSGPDWHYGTTGPVPPGMHDFYSVAIHELGHILGVGSTEKWASLVSNGAFRGSQTMQRYGDPVPVDDKVHHFAEGVSDPQFGEASLDPTTPSGTRKEFTPLDFAALADLGWTVTYDPNAQRHLANVISPLGINEGKFNHAVAGDFNDDGRDDLLFVDQASGQNRWYFGRPDGTFDFGEDRIERWRINHYDHLVGGDFDGDGRDDLLGHGKGSGANRWFFSRPEHIDSDGFDIVDSRVPEGLLNGGFDHVVVGNFNGLDPDGKRRDDVVFQDVESGQNRWYFARADGGLDRRDDVIGRDGMNDGFANLVAGDFNGDGRDDLLLHDIPSGKNFWFHSQPDGSFSFTERIAPGLVNANFDHFVVGNFNGIDPDGRRRDDLLFHSTANGENRWFYLGEGGWEFRDSPVHRAAIDGGVYNHVVTGDFNGDGAADAFFHAQGSGQNILVPGTPQVRKPPPSPPPSPSPPVPPAFVWPPEFSPVGNVTGWFRIQQTRGRQRRGPKTVRVHFQLRNASNLVIRGPFRLVLDHLAASQTVKNAGGKTRRQAPKGSPFVVLSAEAIRPDEEVSVTVVVANPRGLPLRVRPRLLAGDGRP